MSVAVFSFSFSFIDKSGIGGSDYKVLPQLCPLLTPPHSFTTQAVPTTAARRCGVAVELPPYHQCLPLQDNHTSEFHRVIRRVCIQGIGKARTSMSIAVLVLKE